MTYKDYIKLVDAELPELRVSLVPLSAPEMLKMVATQLFVREITEGELADTTRRHLKILWKDGVHGFDTAALKADDDLGTTGVTKPAPGEKYGYNRSEYL